MLDVSKSSIYSYLRHQPSKRSQANAFLLTTEAITAMPITDYALVTPHTPITWQASTSGASIAAISPGQARAGSTALPLVWMERSSPGYQVYSTLLGAS